MAYSTRRRATARRRTVRSRAPARSSYRSRSVRSRGTSRRASGGGGRTIRIEVVSVPHSPVARPEIGLKAAPPARKAAF